MPEQRQFKGRAGKRLKATSAAGASGCLIMDIDGEFFFRVYNAVNEFIDYRLLHCDLQIKIADDEQASFYTDEKETNWLDYSPEVLGLEEVRTKPPLS